MKNPLILNNLYQKDLHNMRELTFTYPQPIQSYGSNRTGINWWDYIDSNLCTSYHTPSWDSYSGWTFDGVNYGSNTKYVGPNMDASMYGKAPWSMEMYFIKKSTTQGTLWSQFNYDQSNYNDHLDHANNSIAFTATPYSSGGGTWSSSAIVPIDQWHLIHLVCESWISGDVYDGFRLKLYINGNLDQSWIIKNSNKTDPYISPAMNNVSVIGTSWIPNVAYYPLNGSVRKFRMWNFALDANDVAYYYTKRDIWNNTELL